MSQHNQQGKSPIPNRQPTTKGPSSAAVASGGSGTPTKKHHQSSSSTKVVGGDKDQVCITRAEVEQAFAFFDVSNSGVLKPRDLKTRLSAFYPHMTNKEYRFLISEPNFTVDTLWSLLENSTITNFDPVAEAFRVYDPAKTGYVDTEELKAIMGRMGYGEMTPDDVEVLIKTADVDGDGRISLEDFRNMLNFNKGRE